MQTMPTTKPAPPLRWTLLAGLGVLGVLGGAAVTGIALIWRDGLAETGPTLLSAHYLAFMCQTFAYHAGLAMVPVAVFGILARRRKLAIAAGIVFLLGVGPECRSLWSRRSPTGAGDGLKVMSINLMYGRSDAPALLAQIADESPDVLMFQEWTPEAGRALRENLRGLYPHIIEQARDDAFGQAVFSKRSFVDDPRLFPPVQGFSEPQIGVSVSVGGRTMRLQNVHLLPPVGRTYFNQQRAGAARLAGWVGHERRDDRPDVLAGDFNAPSRTAIIGELESAGLSDAQAVAGWWRGTTWPRTGTLRWAPGLQLDHVLLRDTVECTEVRTGSDFGSDHRPVIARIRWR